MYWCDSQTKSGIQGCNCVRLEGKWGKTVAKLHIERDIAVWRFWRLAQMGAKEANTLHTLSGFPGLGM